MSGQGERDRKQSRLFPALITGAGGWYLYQYSGPLLMGPLINPLSGVAVGLLLKSSCTILSDVLWWLGNRFDEKSALTPTGKKGTAGWVTSLNEIKHDLIEEGWGPYWGMFKGKEVIASIGSNSLVVGTTGAGKGIGVVQPNILSIRDSKVISDIKCENLTTLARALRERDERVISLNIGGLFADPLGERASYNPLCLIADNFWRDEGLLDISDDIHEIGKQLDPEPVENSGATDNTYFRNGSRKLIGFAIQICVMIDGYDATLGDVTAMLNDKQSLLKHAKWACGRLEVSDNKGQS